jgi:hypothetical protein
LKLNQEGIKFVQQKIKYELQNIISGNGGTGQETLIQAASSYLTTSQSTGENVEGTGYTKRQEEKDLEKYISNLEQT